MSTEVREEFLDEDYSKGENEDYDKWLDWYLGEDREFNRCFIEEIDLYEG